MPAVRSTVLVVSGVVLMLGCQMKGGSYLPYQRVTNGQDFAHMLETQTKAVWFEDKECLQEIGKADLVIDFQFGSWTKVKVSDKKGQDRTIQGNTVEKLLEAVFNDTPSGASNLVAVVPNTTVVNPARPQPSEIMRQITTRAKDSGFHRVLFQSVGHGFRYHVYPMDLHSFQERDGNGSRISNSQENR